MIGQDYGVVHHDSGRRRLRPVEANGRYLTEVLLLHFLEILVSNLGGDTGYPKLFPGLHQSLQKM